MGILTPVMLSFSSQVWFWGSVNRIVEGFNGGEPVFWLYIMQNMFSSSQVSQP